ncbi:MAG: hypothetical protein QOK15_1585 [Nocardioidaceae bacterium]|nr:hypothetical protein [Nocardioidaceae bacterium]
MVTVRPAEPGVTYDSAAGRWVLAATVLGSGMAFLDGTVVNVALPAMGQDLGTGLAGLQWTVNAYTLTLASFILLGGAAGDRFGRRRVFVIGVVAFAAASALCGLATTPGLLIAARALQGVGGALLTPGSLAILQSTYREDDRARAVGSWSGLTGVAGAVGPFLGGWLVEAVSWRLVFFINVPIAAVVLWLASRHVPESRDEAAPRGFDVSGAVLCAVALGATTYGLIGWGAAGRWSATTGVAVVLGVLVAAAFVRTELRSSHPMLPFHVFRSGLFRTVNAVTFLVYAGLGAVFFFLVITLQVLSGFSPVAAGAALLPVTVVMLAFSARAGDLAQRIGPRLPMTIGPVVAGAGVAWLSRIGTDASYVVDLLPGALLLGLGLCLTVAPLTATTLAAVPVGQAGVASGINNAVARTAGLLAVAALPAVVGLRTSAYADPAALQPAFRAGMLVAAALLVSGGVLSALALGRPQPTRPLCRRSCSVEGPPLEPEPVGAAGHGWPAG